MEVQRQFTDYTYKNKIDRKSVDFILANKETLATEKVIELDDYSHLQPARIET